ncbi:MAG: HEAT repeat domain-containing protein [Nitrospinota bacterium]|nr:HEAT repeat domain-containing protein [Nitrospinota bacterium]
MNEVEFFISQLESEEFSVRRQAAEMLGEFGESTAVKPLLALLGDDHWQVRNTAATSLVKIKEKESIAPLIDCLRDPGAAVRNTAMTVLQEMGEDVAQPLGEILNSDPTVDVRIYCANTLGNLGKKEALNYLLNSIYDPDENVRYAIVEALGRIGSPEAVDTLLEAVVKEETWSKFPYITALGLIGDERALPSLIEMLDDPILGYPAISAIGMIGELGGLLPIINVISGTDDKNLIKAGITSLAMIRDREREFAKITRHGFYYYKANLELKKLDSSHIIDAIIEMLSGGKTEEVKSALNILWDFRGKFSVEHLLPLLEDPAFENEVRELITVQGPGILANIFAGLKSDKKQVLSNLIRIIGLLGKEDDSERLLPFLDSPDSDIVADTIKSLGMMQASLQFDKIVPMLSSPEESIRKAAVGGMSLLQKFNREKIKALTRSGNENIRWGAYRALGFSSMGDVAPILLNGFSDPSPKARAAAVHSFGYQGNKNRDNISEKDLFTSISKLFNDDDFSVRVQSIWTLSSIVHPTANELLVNLLGEVKPDTLNYVVRAIGKRRLTEASEPLLKLLTSDTNSETKIVAITALGKCGDEKAIPALRNILDDEIPELVAETVSTLALLGGEKESESILPCLERESWIIQSAVLGYITDYTIDSALPRVETFLKLLPRDDSNILLLHKAMKALSVIGGAEHAEMLLEYLGVEKHRFEAYSALNTITDKHGIVFDPSAITNHTIRKFVYSLPAFIEKSESVEFLFKGLQAASPSIRRISALALSSSADSKIIDLLQKGVEGENDPWIKKLTS